MIDKQEKAIKQLERAFAACLKARLVFQFMDCRLHAFDEKEYDLALEAYRQDVITAMNVLILSGNSLTVNTGKLRIDGGGW